MSNSMCTPDACANPGPRGGRCKSCTAARQLALFYANHEARLAYNAQWRAANHEHDKQRQKDWYGEHTEYFAAKYQANRDVLLDRMRAHRAANPGAETENSRRWRKAHPKRWALRNRENSRRRQTGTTHSRVSYAEVLARDGMVCHICKGDILSLDDLHFDHVIPLAKGGLHIASNIKPAHALCNLRKSDKII